MRYIALMVPVIALAVAGCASHPTATISPTSAEGTADLAVCSDVADELPGSLSHDEQGATPDLVTLADTWGSNYAQQQTLEMEDHPILALAMVPKVAGDSAAVQGWCNDNIASS